MHKGQIKYISLCACLSDPEIRVRIEISYSRFGPSVEFYDSRFGRIIYHVKYDCAQIHILAHVHTHIWAFM